MCRLNKVDPNDIAKWFCLQGVIEKPNSREGKKKIQKLLFFAQLIYMVKNNGNTMFNEEFKAFKDGVILESVMYNYWNRFSDMFSNINANDLNINPDIINILNLTVDIFGDSSAQELSELSKEFNAWNYYFDKSKRFGFYIKNVSLIPYDELKKELYRIDKVLKAYELTKQYSDSYVEDY